MQGTSVNIIAQLAKSADYRSNDIAIIDDSGVELTYGEWWRRAVELAAVLPQIPAGERILLAFHNAEFLDFATAYMAVMATGAVATPVALPQPRHEINRIIDIVGPRYLLSTKSVDSNVEYHIITELLANGVKSEWPRKALVSHESGSPAQILFSSGTTGTPSAIIVPHGNLGWSVKQNFDAREGTLLHTLPLGTSAFQNQLVRTITHDYPVRVLSGFDPARLNAVISTSPDVTSLVFPPAMVAQLGRSWTSADVHPQIVAVGMTGSFPTPDTHSILQHAFPNAKIFTSYGSTEASPAGTSGQYDPRRPRNVGRPREGTSLRITDEAGRVVQNGRVGRIWLSAHNAPTRTYLDPNLNVASFDQSWVRTSDFGYLAEDGSLELVGRASNIIAVGGRKVSVEEVEYQLLKHPRVFDVLVEGRNHTTLGQEVCAKVVASDLTAAELREFARHRLSPYKVPSRIDFVTHLERNSMGKILRRTPLL
ncbi:class I adenylate-forming enzyme family protein [Nesterenkonia alkaliphila]|nr:class I adenylate-forming enzyme family protein [Nesterenkonia alkaliphila]